MILQEKIQKKAEGYGKLAPVFLEGAEFVLKNLGEDKILCNKRDITIDKKLPKSIEERWRLEWRQSNQLVDFQGIGNL